MIEERGVITAVLGRYAQVRTERKSACGQCAVNGACGTSLLERLFGRRQVELTALNTPGAQVGDLVCVGISEAGLLRAAIVAYLVPILALIVGAGIGEHLGGLHAPLVSLLGAGLGFALALLWLRSYSVALSHQPGRQPMILRRLSATSSAVAAPQSRREIA